MDISNKTLALLLIGAIIVSLAGTILSLSKIGEVSVSGLATGTGTVDLNIEKELSITTIDSNAIDFDTCAVNTSADQLVSSNETLGGDHGLCGNYTTPQYIAVRNDGNVRVTLDVDASAVGQAQNASSLFLSSESNASSLAYMFTNDGHEAREGGCDGTLASVGSFTVFQNTSRILVCDDFGYAGGLDSILMDLQINLPQDVDVGENTVTFTFTAEGS